MNISYHAELPTIFDPANSSENTCLLFISPFMSTHAFDYLFVALYVLLMLSTGVNAGSLDVIFHIYFINTSSIDGIN